MNITQIRPADRSFIIEGLGDDTFMLVKDGKFEAQHPLAELGKTLAVGDWIPASTFVQRASLGETSFDESLLEVDSPNSALGGMEILFRAYKAWEESPDARRRRQEAAFCVTTLQGQTASGEPLDFSQEG